MLPKMLRCNKKNDRKQPRIFEDLSLIEFSSCQIIRLPSICKFEFKMQLSKTNLQKAMAAFDRVLLLFQINPLGEMFLNCDVLFGAHYVTKLLLSIYTPCVYLRVDSNYPGGFWHRNRKMFSEDNK